MLKVIGPLLCTLLSLGGCTTLPDGRSWGEDATLTPGWQRIAASARQAAQDPWVWAPLLGAAVMQIDDWDTRVADWARERRPVFDSTANAEDWSDHLRDASAVVHYGILLATPSGDSASEWVLNKARGALVSVGAVSSTVFVTRTLKTQVDRDRPNGLAGESFPSGHASSSAVHTALASHTLQSVAMSDGWRTAADAGLRALTLGTSWARIEAGWHYPSDTLFSLALGQFIATVAYDAFMGLDTNARVALLPVEAGAVLSFSTRF